ncbi:MAG TPA: carbohydrate ABC transporter permease [Rugosimonospora sp.]|nr:carbohydrate ABC transporter permease [Rugosimonospora sp.]
MSVRTRRAKRAGQYAALAAYLVFLGFPLLWMLSTAFKGPRELVELHPSLWPSHPTLDNFVTAFTSQDLVRSAWNSTRVAVAAAVLTVLVALPSSYALARFRTRLGTIAIGWVLVSQLFPFILLIIPLFVILKRLSLANSLVGLVLVYVVWSLPFVLWMLQSFVRSIPRDLEEAAAIDGASRLQILRRVVAPLLAPGIVASTLFAFVSAWNEFFFALVILQDPEKATVPVTLARFVGIQGVVRLGPLAAGAFVATLPSLIVFGLLQRRLTSGILAGAVKG